MKIGLGACVAADEAKYGRITQVAGPLALSRSIGSSGHLLYGTEQRWRLWSVRSPSSVEDHLLGVVLSVMELESEGGHLGAMNAVKVDHDAL